MTSTEIIAYWMEALHLSTHSFAQLVGVPESTIRMRIKRSTFTTFDEMCRYAKLLGIKEQVFLFPEVYPQKVRETAKKYAIRKRQSESLRAYYANGNKPQTDPRACRCLETGIVYATLMEAERNTGADHAQISRCCRGKRQTAGGYRWSFIEQSATGKDE